MLEGHDRRIHFNIHHDCDFAYFRVQKETTAPDRIRESSPTSLLAGRFPAYLRRSDGMRSFLESVAVDIV
jgi:hypothetical protein